MATASEKTSSSAASEARRTEKSVRNVTKIWNRHGVRHSFRCRITSKLFSLAAAYLSRRCASIHFVWNLQTLESYQADLLNIERVNWSTRNTAEFLIGKRVAFVAEDWHWSSSKSDTRKSSTQLLSISTNKWPLTLTRFRWWNSAELDADQTWSPEEHSQSRRIELGGERTSPTFDHAECRSKIHHYFTTRLLPIAYCRGAWQ